MVGAKVRANQGQKVAMSGPTNDGRNGGEYADEDEDEGAPDDTGGATAGVAGSASVPVALHAAPRTAHARTAAEPHGIAANMTPSTAPPDPIQSRV